MTARMNFEFGFQNQAQRLDSNTPLRVYFCGDFSGQNEPAKKITAIDIDNFDEVMTKISPKIVLNSGHELVFNELDDFHPDNLFETAIFSNLRRLRRELSNSQTAARAADEIWKTYQLAPVAENDATEQATEPENSDDMFERLLGSKGHSDSIVKAGNALDQYISKLLAPHIVSDILPEHQNLLVFIDTVIEDLMNSILHSQTFQSLEAIWRATYDVMFNEDYDEETQFFYLVDASKQRFAEALTGNNNLAEQLVLHAQNVDEPVHHLIIGNYNFSANDEDLKLLSFAGAIASQLQGRFLAGANEALVEGENAENWQHFRACTEATRIGLSYPRILLRLPYGKKYQPVDPFEFEEFRSQHQHHHLLWGNSAFSWARLLIRQYHAYQTTETNDINNLPSFVYTEDDEQKLKACAEHYLSEQQLNQLVTQGIMPFISFHNRNSVRLYSGQMVAIN